MRLNDAISGLVLSIFAIAVIAYSTTFPSLHGQAYGPSLFPTLIGSCLLACGLILIVRGLKLYRRNDVAADSTQTQTESASTQRVWVEWGDWIHDKSRLTNMVLVPGLLISYILLSDWIGFIPLSIVIIGTLLYRLGNSLITAVLVATTATITLQLLFAKVLLVPLPPGLLLRWIG
ncbi:MAG: tripartite tricarboxylate transporter TctB family protein [Granulosicoccus sp.]